MMLAQCSITNCAGSTHSSKMWSTPLMASFAYYATCVASGSLSWGDHLRMVTFRHGLSPATLSRCAFCPAVLTATHFQEDCRYSRLWSAVLYTQMASDLRRIIPEWSVSLPTYWGVLVHWGGMYLGVTTENAAVCPVPHVSWITLSLTRRVLPASEKAVVQHGATPQQVRRFLLAFWRVVLRMSSNAHPPQLRNEGDGARPGHARQAFDYLYLDRDFPAAGHWHLQPPESSPVPQHSICTFGTTSPVCPSTSRTDAWRTLGLERFCIGFTLDRGWRSTLSGRVLFRNELCCAMWLTFKMRKRLGSSNPPWGYVATGPSCAPLLILSSALKHRGPPRRQGLYTHWTHFWATFDFVPRFEASGTPPDGKVYVPLKPTCVPILILSPALKHCGPLDGSVM